MQESKKDWKKIARANGLAVPEAALERVSATLDGLEAAFRPLVQRLGPDMDPAPVFRADACDAEGGE